MYYVCRHQMINTRKHIRFIKNTLLLIVVLFSLTPCSVKESSSFVFNLEYQRPLNKTRALVSQDKTCESSVFNQLETVKTQELLELNVLATTLSSNPLLVTDIKKRYLKNNYEKPSNHSRPLYILYNRLKLDIA